MPKARRTVTSKAIGSILEEEDQDLLDELEDMDEDYDAAAEQSFSVISGLAPNAGSATTAGLGSMTSTGSLVRMTTTRRVFESLTLDITQKTFLDLYNDIRGIRDFSDKAVA